MKRNEYNKLKTLSVKETLKINGGLIGGAGYLGSRYL